MTERVAGRHSVDVTLLYRSTTGQLMSKYLCIDDNAFSKKVNTTKILFASVPRFKGHFCPTMS